MQFINPFCFGILGFYTKVLSAKSDDMVAGAVEWDLNHYILFRTVMG